MWPFSGKKKDDNARAVISVAAALEGLASVGVRVRPGVSTDDLLFSLGGTMESPVDRVALLCVLGSEVERGDFKRVSDDIWHVDAECIEDHGAYVVLLERFVVLAKGSLPITSLRDFVDIEAGKAWVEFELEGKKVHWDLEVNDDWMDPEFYSRLQELVTSRGAGKQFFIAGLGQDSLLSFGDDTMRQALCKFSGLKFQWE